MKSLVALMTLFLSVMLCGCGEKGGPSGESSSGGSPSGTTVSGIPVTRPAQSDKEGKRSLPPPLTTVDKEAAKQAIDRWKLTRIGDGESYYVCQSEKRDVHVLKKVFELRKVSVELSPDGITEADKLNGKEWIGSIQLRYAAMRTYTPMKVDSAGFGEGFKLYPKDRVWSEWGTVEDDTNYKLFAAEMFEMPRTPATIRAARINGKWHLQAPDFEQVQPSDLPK